MGLMPLDPAFLLEVSVYLLVYEMTKKIIQYL